MRDWDKRAHTWLYADLTLPGAAADTIPAISDKSGYDTGKGEGEPWQRNRHITVPQHWTSIMPQGLSRRYLNYLVYAPNNNDNADGAPDGPCQDIAPSTESMNKHELAMTLRSTFF